MDRGCSYIEVRGAREHNLRGVDLRIPRDSLVVITGLSGSGKSSLAFDTIYQEGQRRFMESLSAYARQFLGKMERPKVELVEGLSPTICIDQKTVNRNPRSTVGTVTEIFDHIRLLYARLGTARCPSCLRPIQSSSPGQLGDALLRDFPGSRLHVMAPIVRDRKGEYRKELAGALADGFIRARIDGQLRSLEEDISLARYEKHTIELVVDRLRLRADDRPRLLESTERALRLAEGTVSFLIEVEGQAEAVYRLASSARSCPEHGISLPEMEPRLFSFNAPQGMCTGCAGLGELEGFDLELLIDPSAPLERAFGPLRQAERLPFTGLSREVLRGVADQLDIPAGATWQQLSEAQRHALLRGAPVEYELRREVEGRSSLERRNWAGLLSTLEEVWHYTRLPSLSPFRRSLCCPACAGRRLNPIALAVDFRGVGIWEMTGWTVEGATTFFSALRLAGAEALLGEPIVREIRGRLGFLSQVGLGYLSLGRSAATLSGGEAQRIRLASQVGSGLQGVTYVLDEPSIGLHPRDQLRLLGALERLRDQGNSVLVVEHDATTMAHADYLVEVGPGAGREGGLLMAAGSRGEFWRSDCLTARFLRGEERILPREGRRVGNGRRLCLRGARAHNLKDVDLELELGTFTAITGVSGGGKSTLIERTLCRALAARLHGATDRPGEHRALEGVEHIEKIVQIDQAPIGRTPRSNPATYTGAMDHIRALYAEVPEARARGYQKGRFSFNLAGGRCEECQGAGVVTVEMQFLADVEVPCEACNGRRFNSETLDIRYKGLTITEALGLTIREAREVFGQIRPLRRILDMLIEVGLDYISLGQPSTTLSGGEAQRIKLAEELARPSQGRTLYVLDEPTTGLHMADVRRLIGCLQRLVDLGNTVVVIEHNTDVIWVADRVIDLGPEGGEGGGRIIGQGRPEELAGLDSPTGRALAQHFRSMQGETGPLLVEEAERVWQRPSPDIRLRGVHTHNLQGLDLDLPQGRMSVITGPSGSGKTSLAFDTLFAEGQRRYVESLSTYARRFLGRMDRAPVDRVEGLQPAIAIDQRNRGHNPRSTVATVTELYDSFRLLYARIGRAHCPRCARPVRPWSPSAVARDLMGRALGAGHLLAPLAPGQTASGLRAEGYIRVYIDGRELELEELAQGAADQALPEGAELVVDRLDPRRAGAERMAEAAQVAFRRGGGRLRFLPRGGEALRYSEAAECPEHGRVLPEELTPRHFSFNSHLGACTACLGLGRRTELDPELVFPRRDLPLAEGMDGRLGSVLLRSPRSRATLDALLLALGSRPQEPISSWSPELWRAVMEGWGERKLRVRYTRSWGKTTSTVEEEVVWEGLIAIADGWSAQTSWLRRERSCSACGGARLKPELLAVTLGDRSGAPPGLSISGLCALTVAAARDFWSALRLGPSEAAIAEQPLKDLLSRLAFLCDVGLGYLGLDRAAESLSGGEAQRIRLATQLGARLTGTTYVLDEPTVGLHPRDTQRLLGTLLGLRDLGNTLVVVEHDPEVIQAADHVVDLGPGAGEHGGRLIDQGSPAALKVGPGLTGQFLSGRRRVQRPAQRRSPRAWIELPPARLHNLQGAELRLPRGCFTAVTGVSGSGKSTLLLEHGVPWLTARKAGEKDFPGLVVVDQQPIGTTPRSTPATFCDLLGPIRELYASLPLSRERGWGPGRYSFNTPEGGRCTECEGRGATLVEMHFLSDVWVRCEGCGGRRFDASTLEVRWKGHSIADALDLPVDEALELFRAQRKLARRLSALSDVGLGYVRLGQDGTTLSGGEAQRMKLANELVGRAKETIYLLDEPTTGLHLADVDRLLTVLHRLVDQGHSVVVIEHHLDMIENADHVIELGPEGGAGGGQIVALGSPEELARADTATGQALRRARAN